MKANLYKGCGIDGRLYYTYMDDGVDGTKMKDGEGKFLIFIKKETITGEIVSWKPFRALIREDKQMTFVCPNCGCKNCERDDKYFSDPHFWQGNFVCSNCKQGGFNYYSDCFIESARNETQLSLF